MVERLPLSKTLPVLCRQLAAALPSTQSLEGPWTSEKECFLAIVNQAIECRAAGDPATSLLILEWLRDQGIEHPYLLFHRIAALIDLDRYTEALLCLPALAALEQANMLKAASDVLQIHIDTLLRNMRGHCNPSRCNLLHWSCSRLFLLHSSMSDFSPLRISRFQLVVLL